METFIEFLKAIVFGIIEGVTEWLPVSSTGHMIILEEFFSLATTQGTEFFDFFIVIIQLGAILAVIINFFSQLWPFGKKKTKKQKVEIWQTWLKILIASIPAGVVGLIFDDWLESHLYGYLTVSITLITYGVLFIVIEFLLRRKAIRIKQRYHLNRESDTISSNSEQDNEDSYSNYPLFNITSVKELTIQHALIIGLAQMLALIPGTSRSGVTICAALLLSVDRRTAAKFSFFMSIPAMVGGSLVKAISFARSGAKITGLQIGLILVGMAVAFVVSLIVVKFFMTMLRTKTFNVFGIYRILLGIILIIVYYGFLQGKSNINNTVQSVLPYINTSYISQLRLIKQL